MPSINASDAGLQGSGGGWNFPWKALGVVALIACSAGYGMYQYEQYFPSRKSQTHPAAAAVPAGKGDVLGAMKKLNLTEEQRGKLAAIDSQSTDTRSKLRQASRVLTADQRKQLQQERAQTRKVAQERAARRKAKYFPTASSAAYAKQAGKAAREQRQARRKAAQQASVPAQRS